VAIQVVPYTEEWVEEVRAFNGRMRAANLHWTWYTTPVDAWLPEPPGKHKTWREHHLAIEDGRHVRGAFALKPHEWWVRGQPRTVTDWHGPITEAAHDPRFAMLGVRLMREMLRQHPLLYSWGHGGAEQPMLKMIEKMGFVMHATPFCLRILRPYRFLRRNRYLRLSPRNRLVLDAAAFSGAGGVALPLLHAALAARARRSAPAQATPFERFEPWADALWERCRDRYAAIATRDADTMNVLLRPGGWPAAIKLRVERGGETLGWAAVLDTQMEGDRRFGTLRLGSLIDALARPEDAEAVVGAAFRFLRARGVDLVVSNQAHPAWAAGFAAHGFLVLPGRRLLAMSPALRDAFEPLADTTAGLHMTNLDGHGPMRM
jgi:hypothetical protein